LNEGAGLLLGACLAGEANREVPVVLLLHGLAIAGLELFIKMLVEMFSLLVASLFGSLAAILLPLVEGKLLVGLSNSLGHVHLAAFAFDQVVAFIRLAALRV